MDKFNNTKSPIVFMVMFLIILSIGIVTMQYAASNAQAIRPSTVYSPTDYLFNNNGSSITLDGVPDTLTATNINNSWIFFNASPRYLGTPFNDKIYTYSNRTFSFWIKCSNTLVGIPSLIEYPFTKFKVLNDTALRFYVYNTSEVYNQSVIFNLPSGVINDSQWHHVVGRYNNYNYSLTISYDNVFITNNYSSRLGYNFGSFGTSIIGSSSSSPLCEFDEFRFYFDPLPNTEITNLYNSGRKVNTSLTDGYNLTVYCPLNEESGVMVYNLGSGDKLNTSSQPNYFFRSNDNITNTLIEDTDYKLSSTTFTLINPNLAYSNITVDYDYTVIGTSSSSTVANLIPIVVVIILIVVLLIWINSQYDIIRLGES